MVNKKILGMDIGGTNLRMGLVDETLSVSGRPLLIKAEGACIHLPISPALTAWTWSASWRKTWAYQPSLTTMPTTSWHMTSTSSGFL